LNEDGTETINTSPLTTSRLACPQDTMEQEQDYLISLQQVNCAMDEANRIIQDAPSGNLDFYLIVEY
jgi:hypothetical protein